MSPIDTNMVRPGVVSHPSQWAFPGYNEIQQPRRKNLLVDYDRLPGMLGAGSYEQLRCSHKGWVEECLGDKRTDREEEWTGSIAVGSRPWVEKVKGLLGLEPKGFHTPAKLLPEPERFMLSVEGVQRGKLRSRKHKGLNARTAVEKAFNVRSNVKRRRARVGMLY